MFIAFSIFILGFYLTAGFIIGLYLKKLSPRLLQISRWFLGGGIFLHVLYILFLFSQKDSLIPNTSSESHLVISLVIALIAFVLSFRKTAVFLVWVLIAMSGLGLLSSVVFAATPTIAAVSTPWLWTHIFLTIFGEAFFAVAAGISLVYWIIDARLRRRQLSFLVGRFASLPSFDDALGEILVAGFVFLSLGMFFGFFFAEVYWKKNWMLDSKTVFCLLTWVLYAVLLLLRSYSTRAHGKISAMIAVIGFIVILLLSWGVDHYIPSQHRLFENQTSEIPSK